ncbi:MAG: ROK family protein [Nitrospiraceae bacterium]|nr:MAG: ROK family protein [Nitrospiraceae bacterium]
MKIAVGIDIGGTNTKNVLVTETGEVLLFVQNPTPCVTGGENAGIDQLLVQHLRNFLSSETAKTVLSEKAGTTDIAGIGIGVAGLIDRANGKIIKSPNITSADGLPIKELFEKEFSLPVTVENDANAYAYGEKWVGIGKDINNFAILTLGTGLGGGHIYKGELYEAPFEIGHVIIEPNGRFCPCGSSGCLESYASGRAIVDRAITSIQSGVKSTLIDCCEGNYYKITPELVFEKALDGDSLSREIFREVGYYLGLGIANLVNLLRIDAIIIGGGLIGAWELFIEELAKEASRRGFKPYSTHVKILRSALAKDAGSIGAAGLLFRKLSAASSSLA